MAVVCGWIGEKSGDWAGMLWEKMGEGILIELKTKKEKNNYIG